MYRIVVVTFALFSLTAAATIPDESQARIIAYDNTSDPDGSYKFSYKTSNGISRSESGFLVNVGQENEHMVVSGSYSYIDTDGKKISVRYIADENGFRIQEPLVVTQALPAGVVASLLGK